LISKNELFNFLLNNFKMSSNIEVYTDGSCIPNPGKGGWAYIILQDEKEIKRDFGNSKISTNNIMEMTSVIEALKFLQNKNNFTIYSDSQYVIHFCNGTWKKANRKKNLDLWAILDKVSLNKNIKWVHVRSHTGIFYNELVDSLAKNAII
jgi:ribonuclease HI